MTETSLPLIETTVSEHSIHMRYADHEDAAKAATWVDFQVSLAELGDAQTRLLAEVRLAALRAARDIIGGEIHRLAELVDRRNQ